MWRQFGEGGTKANVPDLRLLEEGKKERERERQVESKLQEREREGEKHQRKQIKAWVLHGSSIRDPLSFSRFQW